MLTTMEQLSHLTAPSGWEQSVRDVIKTYADQRGFSCETDRLGNLLVHVPGAQAPKMPILLGAHMDEPGFMVEEITKEGLLKFGLMGSIARRNILGRQVMAGDDGYRGVVGLRPIHLTTAEERKKLPKVEDLYIDLGFADKKETEAHIQLGESGVFAEPFRVLGDKVLGKAMSRSVGCAVLLKLMEQALPVDVTLAFTVQHHVGCRGAYGVGAGCEGNYVVLDTCPGTSGDGELPELGKGPVIPRMDKNAMFDRELTQKLLAAAKNIPVQSAARTEVAGDGGGIQQSGHGNRVAALYCPAAYDRAPCQMVDPKDAERMLAVLTGFLEEAAR